MMEAEYTAASRMTTEFLGVREPLGEFELKAAEPLPLRVDNHQLDEESPSTKAKHIEVQVKFVGRNTYMLGARKLGACQEERTMSSASEEECWDLAGSVEVQTRDLLRRLLRYLDK
ncbi:polyprotein [Phytophthora megakarya]|uniref:Polyprotein n=1 Tax=Phytophthora megakarya TaxID=4795 RepID=A0A225WGN6_9STRA|nr:polyprotein [Phytophthora megakarya]